MVSNINNDKSAEGLYEISGSRQFRAYLNEYAIMYHLEEKELDIIISTFQKRNISISFSVNEETRHSQMYKNDSRLSHLVEMNIDEIIDEACEINFEELEKANKKTLRENNLQKCTEGIQLVLKLNEERKILEKAFKQTSYYKIIKDITNDNSKEEKERIEREDSLERERHLQSEEGDKRNNIYR